MIGKNWAREQLMKSELLSQQLNQALTDNIKLHSKLTLAIEALEKISNMVTWVDEKNQKISHTYAMGTVDVATKTLKQIRGENE